MIKWDIAAVERFLGVSAEATNDPDITASFAIPLASGEARLTVQAFGDTANLTYTPFPGSPEIYGVLRCTRIEIKDDPEDEDGERLVMSGPLGGVSIWRRPEGLGLTFGLYLPEDPGAEKERPRNGLRDATLFIAGVAAASLLMLLLMLSG